MKIKTKKQIVLFNGGQSAEHDISLVSCEYLKGHLKELGYYHVHEVMLSPQGQWLFEGGPCFVSPGGKLHHSQGTLQVDAAIAYLHGHPGETGELLALLELYGIPHLGPCSEAASLSFNKASAKYWLEGAGVPVCPGVVLCSTEKNELAKAHDFFQQQGEVFVKPSSQGSSRGCSLVAGPKELEKAIAQAFEFSPYVLVEKKIEGRELEVAVYEYEGEVHVSLPGEIIVPRGEFYNYEEKYSQQSQSETKTVAPHLSRDVVSEIQSHALCVFHLLKLSDLARVDFFYSEEGGILFNEVNIFPGLTPISMFPKMLEQNGPLFRSFLQDRLNNLIAKT